MDDQAIVVIIPISMALLFVIVIALVRLISRFIGVKSGEASVRKRLAEAVRAGSTSDRN
jgi:hypothetical protein